MAKGDLMGLMTCPDCDFPDAEVKEDKNGHPYRFCPDCTLQTFTRGEPKRVKNMLGKMRPVNQPPAAAADTVPEPKPAKRGFSLEDL